jgi:hypothetical protein
MLQNADGSTYQELAQHIYSCCNAPESRDQSLGGIRFAHPVGVSSKDKSAR